MARPSSQPRKPKSAPKLAKLVEKHYGELAALAHQRVFAEMGTRTAFFTLLAEARKPHGWTLIAEHSTCRHEPSPSGSEGPRAAGASRGWLAGWRRALRNTRAGAARSGIRGLAPRAPEYMGRRRALRNTWAGAGIVKEPGAHAARDAR